MRYMVTTALVRNSVRQGSPNPRGENHGVDHVKGFDGVDAIFYCHATDDLVVREREVAKFLGNPWCR